MYKHMLTKTLLTFSLVFLALPSMGDFRADDEVHNQAHFDSPIVSTERQTNQPTTSTTIVTADQQVIVVPNPTEVVRIKRSFWDSRFWDTVNIRVTNGYYGDCGYYYCGSYRKTYGTRYYAHHNRKHHNRNKGRRNKGRRNNKRRSNK